MTVIDEIRSKLRELREAFDARGADERVVHVLQPGVRLDIRDLRNLVDDVHAYVLTQPNGKDAAVTRLEEKEAAVKFGEVLADFGDEIGVRAAMRAYEMIDRKDLAESLRLAYVAHQDYRYKTGMRRG